MFGGHLNVGDLDTSGNIELELPDFPLGDPFGAEVLLAIHSHGPSCLGRIWKASSPSTWVAVQYSRRFQVRLKLVTMCLTRLASARRFRIRCTGPSATTEPDGIDRQAMGAHLNDGRLSVTPSTQAAPRHGSACANTSAISANPPLVGWSSFAH